MHAVQGKDLLAGVLEGGPAIIEFGAVKDKEAVMEAPGVFQNQFPALGVEGFDFLLCQIVAFLVGDNYDFHLRLLLGKDVQGLVIYVVIYKDYGLPGFAYELFEAEHCISEVLVPEDFLV